MAIGAGDLDRRIVLERFALTRDAQNNPIEAWAPLAHVAASKLDVSDTERLRAAQVGSAITTRFVIRWSKRVADLNTKDRLTSGGLTYNIVGVKEIGRREEIEITAAAASDLFMPAPVPAP